ncbi:four-carbon acid sugar kinase family protein [Lacticaseibacillus hegangensis]|uniref:Four-carbon acid sugar kinase family protein n=1 Tax=Lacticaseibacillus hegangensis TaxID=2486010 RepID=A0ABW4CYU9_9LACO|nr:four-carbon acid sugar kinase family protein [Lacticaseibacillus hegangensis]
MDKGKYLIIADDFTGSNDTGVQLKNNGIDVDVTLFPTDEKLDSSVVLDTESRTIPATDAYKKVLDMTKKVLKNNQFDIVYKKVDSTIRGNIGQELRAIVEVYQPDKVVFAPAFPKIGRTTKNGIHQLNGVPLMQTEMANDPLNPIWTDNLGEIIEHEFGKDYLTYSVDQIQPGMKLSASKFHIFDIDSDTQLNVLAQAMREQAGKILYVGSAGLASALFDKPSVSTPKNLPTFSVVGSISEVSLKQMNYAAANGISILTIDLNELVKKDVDTEYINRASSLLKAQKDVVLTVSRTKEDYYKTIERFHKLGVDDKFEVSRIIKETLAKVAKGVIAQEEISGMFLTGGDTATEIMHELGATGCAIQRELFTGVVESRLVGGPSAGLDIVTKAGAFGNESTLYESIQILKQKGE